MFLGRLLPATHNHSGGLSSNHQYWSVDSFDLCVLVVDDNSSISRHVLATAPGHAGVEISAMGLVDDHFHDCCDFIPVDGHWADIGECSTTLDFIFHR